MEAQATQAGTMFVPIEFLYVFIATLVPFIIGVCWSLITMFFKTQSNSKDIVLIGQRLTAIDQKIDRENKVITENYHAIDKKLQGLETMLKMILKMKPNEEP